MKLIVAELGAAMGMAVRINTIDVISLIDLGRRFNSPGNVIDATDSRDNPNFISDAGLAICPFISEVDVPFPVRTCNPGDRPVYFGRCGYEPRTPEEYPFLQSR